MKGRTHVAAGITAALLITRPAEPRACFAAVIGGAIGGALSDIDTLDNDRGHDALIAQLVPFGLTALLIAADTLLGSGFCARALNADPTSMYAGLLLYALLWIIGFRSPHRSFTHSLPALALYTGAAGLVCPVLTVPYAVGFLSHIVLDLTNRKRIRLLFPLKGGLCLKLFRADGLADTLVFWACVIAASGIAVNVLVFRR